LGCHTWAYLPKIKGKENIIKYWKDQQEWYYWEDEHDFIEWGNTKDYLFDVYNSWHFLLLQPNNEWWLYESVSEISDEPRIGGYPDKVIHSEKEMLEFMGTGFTNDEGKHFDFYYDADRYDIFMKGIQTFFQKHPDGIITFG